MKSEERHRLKENDLGRVVQTTGVTLERYATAIVACLCAALLTVAVVIWWGRQTMASSSAAWTLLENAESVDDFGSIAEKYKNTPAGDWAKLRESEANLRSGGDVLFSDRELAKADLKRAGEGFEHLMTSTTTGAIIRERAVWGMARCLETTSDGDTAKAIAAYQRLLNEFPESIYKPFAEERIAALKTGGAKEFYAWFSKQNPKPADIRPKDGAVKSDLDPFQLPPAAGDSGGKSTSGDAASLPPTTGGASTDKPASSEVKADASEGVSVPTKSDDAKAEKKSAADEPKPDDKPEQSSDAPDGKSP